MWQNYLIIAARTLAKNRLFTTINLAGLAVGMAACLLIAMWVRSELTYDQWLPDSERVFVVQGKTQYPGRDFETWAGSSFLLLPPLLADFPEIEAGTRLIRTSRALRFGNRIENHPVELVDAGFFDVLALPVVAGSVARAIKEPSQIAVSETFARKWFGAADAVGQTLTITVKGEKRPYQVAAVLRDSPANSVFEFNVVMPLSDKDFANPAQTMQWGSFSSHTLVKLRAGAVAAEINAKADAFIAKHVPLFIKVDDGFYYRPQLRNITQLHLQSPPVQGFYRPPGDLRLVSAIAATGLMILLIATVTYINLATARVSARAREVGLRKALGADWRQLMAQFLVESTLLAALAGLLAVAIVEVALPAFNALLAQNLSIQYGGVEGLLLPLAVMVVVVGFGGGWYPALVLSRLRPREAINGQQGAAGSNRLRQLLVVGQFSVAVSLITCMLVVYAQVSYLRSADMGYNPEGLVLVAQINRIEIRDQQQNLAEAVKRVPGVVAVSRSAFDPAGSGLWRQRAFVAGVPDTAAPQISVQPVDWGYLKAYGARLIAGRDLSEDFGNDTLPEGIELDALIARGANVLINRAALKFFSTNDPKAVIGKTFTVDAGNQGERLPLTVVGVIDDVRLRSARDQAHPAYYIRNPPTFTSLAVRFQGAGPAVMKERLEAVWKGLFPDSPLAVVQVDETIANYYKEEARRGNLFALFAGIAIVLCAAGLYGLAVFTAARRTKEIGIRKVLGASVPDIVKLLVWQFSQPVLLAMLIAWPIAWWLMRDWLAGFETRITLTPLPFLIAGVLAISIAWLTVAWHALRVARTSPIHALRYE